MLGPKAPKDPTAKGSSFYICRQKDVLGNPTPDGKGIQFIYLDDVRLITFAKMVGNITDEAMLEKLKTAQGFLDMVAGIGVTMEADDPDTNIDYVFQMYGKTNPNFSGDTIKVSCRPDGMEKIIWLDDYTWSEENNVVGQMRFEFPKAEMFATVDVKLYLREGYTAPEQEERAAIDVNSPYYQEMMKKSLLNMGNYARVKEVLNKAKRGEEVTMAFIGGSITQGAGSVPINTKSYAYQTVEKCRKEFGENIKLIKAGVGGTPSELGMIRYDRDVLREGKVNPDLVVIEFAVNDAGDETGGVCYESLIRKVLLQNPKTAVVLIYAVFADDWNLQDRLSPIGFHYDVPMVSTKDSVVEQFYKKTGEGRVLSKSQFFYDSFHPTNMGHNIMADNLVHLFRAIDQAEPMEDKDYAKVEPYMGADFTEVHLIDKHTNVELLKDLQIGDFTETDEELQRVEMDDVLQGVPQFPYNWQHIAGDKPFSMKITCKALLVVSKDTHDRVGSGKAVVTVDGKEVLTIDPPAVGWTHCNAQLLFSEKETKEHEVVISMVPGLEDKKLTILGFGYVE